MPLLPIRFQEPHMPLEFFRAGSITEENMAVKFFICSAVGAELPCTFFVQTKGKLFTSSVVLHCAKILKLKILATIK